MPTDNSSFTTAANTNYSWSVLDQYRILTCSGVDARTFLQGQCTNDMLNLAEQGSFGAHCNVKGRMVSSFYCAPIEDAIYLRVHQDICTTTIAALKKYMVFAKAELKANDDLIETEQRKHVLKWKK